MHAALVDEDGSFDRVRVTELPDPEPAAGHVVVAIAAAAVNFPDLLIANGTYQVPFPRPLIPGSEFAGTIRAVGAGVDGLRIGDRVAGTTAVGAFAERIAVAPTQLWHVPDGVDLAEAAAFRVTYLTAYHALRSVAQVQPDDWVLVLGAAGGVGLAALDIAKLLGARVIAAASGPDKLATCHERGADATVDYRAEDLKQRVKEITGAGADVVIDPVGGSAAEPALRASAWGARYVCLGFASGEIPRIPLNLVLLKGVLVCGMEIRTYAERRPSDAARDEAEVLEHFRAGRLRPLIGARFRLDEVGEALRMIAERRAIGKVVISPMAG
jgi:NADPH2:quinone reductase